MGLAPELWRESKGLKILVSVVRFRPRPPLFSAQPFSVGRFRLRIPHVTQGSGPFFLFQPLPPRLTLSPPPAPHYPAPTRSRLGVFVGGFRTSRRVPGHSACASHSGHG